MMFPSLRGGNQNPGQKEGFLGEVDDVLAAADFLVREDYVDPARIYLGGHSTGGTPVMLVAESTPRFRAVLSFGPVNDVRGYPQSSSRSTPPTGARSSSAPRVTGCTRSRARPSYSKGKQAISKPYDR
jgi:dienelactone hydrolase